MQTTPITLTRDKLLSTLARSFVGDRTFDASPAPLTTSTTGGIGGFLGWVWNGTKRFSNFLLTQAGKLLNVNFTELWNYILEKLYQLAYFDWNQADSQIRETIEQNNNAIANILGRFVGVSGVWFTSIVITGAASLKFPVVGGKVALALAQEGGQQVAGELKTAISASFTLLAENAALEGYAWIRKLVNGGETPKNDKPWIFAQQVEKKVNNISNSWLRNFVRGALDGVVDSLTDVGYVVAMTLDDHYAAVREAVDRVEEPVRTLQVFPDADSEELIVITGRQDNVIDQMNIYLGSHELVQNRDLGTVVGQPYDDWYTLQPQSRKLTIQFMGKEKPPFKDQDGKQVQRVQISIPDADPGISWQDLKNKVKKFTWGNFMARGVFENRRQMSLWGSSPDEAKNTLIELAKLSTKKLIQISVSTPEVQNISRRKRPTVVYPAFATMLVRKSTHVQGNTTLIDGQNREASRIRVALWKSEPPQNWQGFR